MIEDAHVECDYGGLGLAYGLDQASLSMPPPGCVRNGRDGYLCCGSVWSLCATGSDGMREVRELPFWKEGGRVLT